MNTRLILILIFIAIFAAFLLLARKGKYREFHKAKIIGSIDTIYRYKSYVMLTVNNNEYRIIPIPVFGNEFQIDDIARKGDSVIKVANNDTLFIIRAGNSNIRYSYTVQTY